ncbi:MAG: DUF4344 domain-containing metallopeptidase [Gemmatimonadales bacterium]
MKRTFFAVLVVLAACRSASEGEPGAGRFVAEYGQAAPEFGEFRAGLIANRFLDTIALRLNDSLKVPTDVTLATAHCAEPNASYDPETHRVTLCYELFEALSEKFENEVGGDYLVSGTLVFALMHELGHGLIDVLELPIVGREEDAVDQLATILLLNQGATGDSLAFGAVGWFALNARASPLDELAFADDHGLNQQRVYNIVCWIYGRDPERYPQVVAEGWLPEPRRRGCGEEYQRLVRNWGRLLEPFRRR